MTSTNELKLKDEIKTIERGHLYSRCVFRPFFRTKKGSTQNDINLSCTLTSIVMNQDQKHSFSPHTFEPPKVPKPPAVMASGHGLPARVHSANAHKVSAQSDFFRAALQTLQSLHPSRPMDCKP